jgi:hypothetical protein
MFYDLRPKPFDRRAKQRQKLRRVLGLADLGCDVEFVSLAIVSP